MTDEEEGNKENDEKENKENDEISPLSLAMKYKFVTPWTSMIVVKSKDKHNYPTPIQPEPEPEPEPIYKPQQVTSYTSNYSYRHISNNDEDEEIEPCCRYSTDDVIAAAEELKFTSRKVDSLQDDARPFINQQVLVRPLEFVYVVWVYYVFWQ
eukprot:308138_1